MNLYLFKYIEKDTMLVNRIRVFDNILGNDIIHGEHFSFVKLELDKLRRIFKMVEINFDIVIGAIDLKGVDKIRGTYYLIDLDYQNSEKNNVYDTYYAKYYYDMVVRNVRDSKIQKLFN